MNQSISRELKLVEHDLEQRKSKYAMILPDHINPERFMRVVYTYIAQNPTLLDTEKVSRASLYESCMVAAQIGLMPEGFLGQGYIIPFKRKAQFLPGYRGLITLARQSGEISTISAHEVCENDEFDFEFGLNERLVHKPATGERGEILYFYAVARYKDGGHYFDVMSKEEVDKIRKRSPGGNSGPWVTDYVEMGKKTAIRRIAKYLPLSVQKATMVDTAHDLGQTVSFKDEPDGGKIVVDAENLADSNEPQEKPTGTSRLDALVDEDTGEVQEADVAEDASAPDDNDAPVGDSLLSPENEFNPNPIELKKTATGKNSWGDWCTEYKRQCDDAKDKVQLGKIEMANADTMAVMESENKNVFNKTKEYIKSRYAELK